MSTPKEQIESLREQINEHDRLYYTEAAPVISDRQYDALFKQLQELEAAHPELITPDSPTQRVSETPIEGFVHVTHSVPMLSIDNTYNESELRDFDQRVAKRLGGAAYEYIVDPKIDGVSAALRYEKGRLVLGATRGDGKVGDDITANIKTIRAIPLKLHGLGWPDVLEVRGEVYWPRPEFDAHNTTREEQGKEPFANPRNATTGSLKSLDSKAIAGRGLAFIAHGFGEISGGGFETAAEVFAAIKQWGIPTSPHAKDCRDIEAVIQFAHQWEQQRHQLDYETDGLVIKIDRLDQREALGATSRYPRWAIAYKYAAEQAESVLKAVDFQVGKLGTITPRAVMEPMQLSGTTVRHASLHNFDQVARLGVDHEGLCLGDSVLVEKAGEIIPQVIRITKIGSPRGEPVQPPTQCPVCKGEVAKDEGGVYIRCINPSCEAQLKERLKFFCGRSQMDIEGLGGTWIERLVDEGIVTSLAGLYGLEEEKLAALTIEGEFGVDNADALLADIESSRNLKLYDALERVASKHKRAPSKALIPLTKEAVQDLATSLPTIEAFLSASHEKIKAAFDDDSESGDRAWAFLEPRGRDQILRSTWALIVKKVIPLKDIGKTTIERLVDSGLVGCPADLFQLHDHRDQLALLRIPRMFGKKNAKRVIASLEASKDRPLSRVLAALNIRYVGAATAELIAEYFGNLENLKAAAGSYTRDETIPVEHESARRPRPSAKSAKQASTEDELPLFQSRLTEDPLQRIEGVGQEVARSVYQFFQSDSGKRTLQLLTAAGVNMTQTKPQSTGEKPLAGKTLVVTGTLQEFARNKAEELIKGLGGKVTSSVSKATDYLVVGENAGSKLDKAKKLGITILDEKAFIDMISSA